MYTLWFWTFLAVFGLQCTWGCSFRKLLGALCSPFSRFRSEVSVLGVVCTVLSGGVAWVMSLSNGRISPVFQRREERFASKFYGVSFNPWHIWVLGGDEIKESLSVRGLEDILPSWGISSEMCDIC